MGANKSQIADATLSQLSQVMRDYGYEIMNTLVTDMSPDERVKASMNEINASKRLKEAASHKAEADKVMQVKNAEGLQSSVADFSEEVSGTTPKDVMDILLLTQYFDTMTAVGAKNMILEHDPQTVASLQKQVSSSFMKNRGKGVFG